MRKSLVKRCFKDGDLHQSIPWWQPKYVVYGFSNHKVKNKLEQLMGSHIVQVTNKDYMIQLDRERREDYLEEMRKKIIARMAEEVQREKSLILDERMSMEKAPEELSNHPVFRVTNMARKIMEEKRLKEEAMKKHKKPKTFDYQLLEGIGEDIPEELEMSCSDLDEPIQETMNKLDELEDYLDREKIFTDEDYIRIKYEDSSVEDLGDAEDVDEMYEMADEILGPITGKACGGLSNR